MSTIEITLNGGPCDVTAGQRVTYQAAIDAAIAQAPDIVAKGKLEVLFRVEDAVGRLVPLDREAAGRSVWFVVATPALQLFVGTIGELEGIGGGADG